MKGRSVAQLLHKGPSAWNEWANGKLEERKVLIETGEWATDWAGRGLNAVTRGWLRAAAVDLDGAIIDGMRFSGLHFPGPARFRNCRFTTTAEFEEATFHHASVCDLDISADFRGSTFEGEAQFDGVVFRGEANFATARFLAGCTFLSSSFHGGAQFARARFVSHADFAGVIFFGIARFVRAVFSGKPAQFGASVFKSEAQFWEARFEAGADYGGCAFEGDALFWESRFLGPLRFPRSRFGANVDFTQTEFQGTVHMVGARCDDGSNVVFDACAFYDASSFDQMQFLGPVRFANSTFEEFASFRSARSEISFSLSGCSFRTVPDFREVRFEHPPVLDGILIPDMRHMLLRQLDKAVDPRSLLFRLAKFRCAPDADISARFAALRSVAAAAKDDLREKEYSVYEIKSRRFWRDRPVSSGASRFWVGLAYQGVSDFGRSFFRPFLLFSLSLVLCGGAYWAYFQINNGAIAQRALITRCEGTSFPLREAMVLSVTNGFLAVNFSGDRLKHSQSCLFGVRSVPGLTVAPDIPGFATALAGLQTAVTALCLFLVGLAVRNQLRVEL